LNEISHIKLSDLTKQVAEFINQAFRENYWIIAEISGHTFYPNNSRHYFKFIEKQEGVQEPIAKVDAVAWSSGSQAIELFERETGQQFTNGLQVLVQVKVEFHSAYGFKLILTDVDRAFTLGNLEKQRRETLLNLVANNPDVIQKIGEEYFTKNKAIQLKSVIQQIAIIGSPKSEGYADFIHTVTNNQHQYKFYVDNYQSSVQGAEAGKELTKTLIAIYNSKIQYDAVVIIRGGGAKTDFLVFDTYDLSRAVARFPIPVITGIGHLRDVSIVDMMAHTSTKTPTKAAEFIIFHNRLFEESILKSQKNIAIKSQQLLASSNKKINETNLIIVNKSRTFITQNKDRLNEFNIVIVNKSRTFIAEHKDQLTSYNQVIINKTKTILYNRQIQLVSLLNQILSKPRIITSNRSADLINIISNMKSFTGKYLIFKRGLIGHHESIVKLMNPKNILKKGFAIISREGKILNNASVIQPGNDLIISMAEYEINTKVISKTQKDGRESNI
jgi:exodeoxyribonuclease VII large subunit